MSTPSQPSFPKWPITVPLLLVGLLFILVTLPATLTITLLLSIHPRYRGAVRALLFLVCYVICETVGVLASVWISLRHSRNVARFQTANFKLQCWWAHTLWKCAKNLFSLTFHSHGTETLDGPAVLMFPRHASIADTILPMVYYAIPQNKRLRYVLKKELQWDPCLEIVGARLPNYFVERGGSNSAAEVAGVVRLLSDAPADQGLLLYPEGTRYTPKKHATLRAKVEEGSQLANQLKRWPNLLPPRLGGYLGLLDTNTQHDLLFMAHTGFEGSANFAELMNGSWSYSQVHMEFWRVPFADIPKTDDERREFLFTQWDRMQQTVERLTHLGN